jgi:hypothetical protein
MEMKVILPLFFQNHFLSETNHFSKEKVNKSSISGTYCESYILTCALQWEKILTFE